MLLEPFEIEGEALTLIRSVGLDPARAPSPAAIANAMPDVDVEYVLRASRPAKLAIRHGRPTLRILNTASTLARAWFIAHELGEIIIHRRGIEHENVEQLADNLGAAIIAPAPAMSIVRARFEDDIGRAAKWLRLSQTITALRYGEVWDRLVIVLERTRVKRRGASFEIPPERELRRIAATGGGDGLSVVPITDAPGRIVLLGE